MSEYQYYEFLAVDQPLDACQLKEMRALSTRARITPTSFVNTYHWGDFKEDPRALMARYFDAFLYLAKRGDAPAHDPAAVVVAGPADSAPLLRERIRLRLGCRGQGDRRAEYRRGGGLLGTGRRGVAHLDRPGPLRARHG